MTQWEMIRNKLGKESQGRLIFRGNALINFSYALRMLKSVGFVILPIGTE